MDIAIFDSKQDLGRAAADRAAAAIGEAIARGGEARVIAATGASQFEFLDALTARKDVDWPRVEMFHLDEYVGVSDTHPASFRRYLRERIVERVHPRAFHFLAGDAADPPPSAGAWARSSPGPRSTWRSWASARTATWPSTTRRPTSRPRSRTSWSTLDEACRRQQLGEGWFATPRRRAAPRDLDVDPPDPEGARDPLHRPGRAQGEGGAGLPRRRGHARPPVLDPAGAPGDHGLPRP